MIVLIILICIVVVTIFCNALFAKSSYFGGGSQNVTNNNQSSVNQSDINNLKINLKLTETLIKTKQKEYVLNSINMAKRLAQNSMSIKAKNEALGVLNELGRVWVTYNNPELVFSFNETMKIIQSIIVIIKQSQMAAK